jgi:hypothetical protein
MRPRAGGGSVTGVTTRAVPTSAVSVASRVRSDCYQSCRAEGHCVAMLAPSLRRTPRSRMVATSDAVLKEARGAPSRDVTASDISRIEAGRRSGWRRDYFVAEGLVPGGEGLAS